MFRPFGTTSTTGSATPFGTPQAPQNTSSFAFNTPAAPSFSSQPSGFGSTGGFGQPSAQIASGFGSTPRYQTTTDNENNVTITLHTVTAMPAYSRVSLEELRLEDYLAGRKGSSAPFPSSSAFGASNTGGFQQQSSAFGGSSGNLFGSGIGGFGASAPATTTSAAQPFGGASTTSGGIFGAAPSLAQPQQPQASTFGSFGTTTSGGGLFGNQPTQANAPSGGIFGSNAPLGSTGPSSNMFGSFAKPATSTTTSFGTTAPTIGFGQPSASTSGGGVFGGSTAPATASSTSLFGKPATTPSVGFSFGQNTAPTAPATTSATAGLFGQTSMNPAATTGLFGQNQPSAFPSGTGAFSFGAAPASTAPTTATTTLPTGAFSFGGAQTPATSQPTQPTGLFGATSATQPSFSFSTQPSSAAPQSTTSVPTSGFSFNLPQTTPATNFQSATSIAPSLPLISAEALSIKPPLPAELTTPKETPTVFSAGTSSKGGVSGRSPARFTPRTSFRLQAPSEVPSSINLNASQSSMMTSTGFIIPRRTSAKKLVVNPSESIVGGTNSRMSRTLSRVGSQIEFQAPSAPQEVGEYGEKYMIPNEATLRKLPYAQLSAVQNFTVGERGVGQVRFTQPVDLTKVPINEIFERIVVFEPRLVTLYPDNEFSEEEKPPVGSGLNIPAEVRLERCWCTSKSDRQPIKDMGDPRLQAHIERLRSMEDTKFVDYIPETGTWIFKVEHFSSYGMDFPEIQKIPKWEQITMEIAKEYDNGVGYRRFGVCWLLDGSGVICRFGARAIWTVLTPQDDIIDIETINMIKSISEDQKFDKDQALPVDLSQCISILEGSITDEASITQWLLSISTTPHVISIVRSKDLTELLRKFGLEKISIMASSSINLSISKLAMMQLEMGGNDAPQKLILELLAGHVISDNLNWHDNLLAALSLPNRSMSEALKLIPNSDLPVILLRHLFLGEELHHHDISKVWILEQLLKRKSKITFQLAGRLMALGFWSVAGKIGRIQNIDAFVQFGLSLFDFDAQANWYGYIGDTMKQFNCFINMGNWGEATRLITPRLVDLIIAGDLENISLLIKKIGILEGWSLIADRYVALCLGSLDDPTPLVRTMNDVRMDTLRKRVAIAEIAIKVSNLNGIIREIFNLLPSDQQRTQIYKLINQ